MELLHNLKVENIILCIEIEIGYYIIKNNYFLSICFCRTTLHSSSATYTKLKDNQEWYKSDRN